MVFRLKRREDAKPSETPIDLRHEIAKAIQRNSGHRQHDLAAAMQREISTSA